MPTAEQDTLAEIAGQLARLDLASRLLTDELFVLVPDGNGWRGTSTASPPADLDSVVTAISRVEGVQSVGSSCLAAYISPIEAALLLRSRRKLPSSAEFLDLASHLSDRAQERYKAEYDADLGLLNRAGLRAQRPDFNEVRGPGESVWLVGFDIDHFKNINDLLDHSAGDAVLAVLAERVRQFASTQRPTGWDILAARTGGEEFWLVVRGVKEDTELIALLGELGNLGKEAIPGASERDLAKSRYKEIDRLIDYQKNNPVTLSIGWVAVLPRDAIGASDQELIGALENAMRRSKDLGRNRISAFRDIRKKLGRVKEHWEENGVVVLDIGADVGVHVGDQFLVFEPEFAQGGNIVISDGRTERPIGTLPRVASVLIEAFEVQREVAFATILDPFGSSAAALKKQSMLDLYYTARRHGLEPIDAASLLKAPGKGHTAYLALVWSQGPSGSMPLTAFEKLGIEWALREELSDGADVQSVDVSAFPHLSAFRLDSLQADLRLSEYRLNSRFRKRKVSRYMQVTCVRREASEKKSEEAFANALLRASFGGGNEMFGGTIVEPLATLAARRGLKAVYSALNPLRLSGFSMATISSIADSALTELDVEVDTNDSGLVSWLQELEAEGSLAAETLLNKAGEKFGKQSPTGSLPKAAPKTGRAPQRRKRLRKRTTVTPKGAKRATRRRGRK